MFDMAAGATGSPDPLEQPPQHIPARQGYRDERLAYRQMLAKFGLEAEQRKHDDLRDHREAVADDDVGYGLDQRHEARLFHCSKPKRLRACRKLAS